ncbi:MAG: TPM domain-containing protein [Polaromonas sp.]|nr:TPM domain-containing protein [Polaromonas sp.]
MGRLTTILKHLWLDEADTARAVPPALLKRLAQRVKASEQQHSGEIRICVEAALPWSYLRRLGHDCPMRELARQRAVMMFGKLRVWDTADNNGVLIYLLLAEHAIEIVADRGIADHVSQAYWQAIVARMALAFRAGRYEDGLTEALEETSAVLMQHYAVGRDDGKGKPNPNELPDGPMLL